MKITAKYHLTNTEKRNIKAMLDAGMTEAKVNTMNLRITPDQKVQRLDRHLHWETIGWIDKLKPKPVVNKAKGV